MGFAVLVGFAVGALSLVVAGTVVIGLLCTGDGIPVAFFVARFADGKRKGRSLGERPAFWTNPWLGWVGERRSLRGCGKVGFAVVAG